MKYRISEDLRSIREMLEVSREELASLMGIDASTINRIESNDLYPSLETIRQIYELAYKKNLKLNEIKSMFYKEEAKDNSVILFHGSKSGIEDNITLDKSRSNNDFGRGFYLGESLAQSISFISRYKDSSAYIFELNTNGLKHIKYDVNRDWMLTIAYFRNTLNDYKDSPLIKKLIDKLENIDYIYAPIADNRMFNIIDTFIEGEITDEQCKHCLAATNLGYQYVIKSKKALKNLKMLENCFVSESEKLYYLTQKQEIDTLGENKVKLARIEYRGKGKYIDEILK